MTGVRFAARSERRAPSQGFNDGQRSPGGRSPSDWDCRPPEGGDIWIWSTEDQSAIELSNATLVNFDLGFEILPNTASGSTELDLNVYEVNDESIQVRGEQGGGGRCSIRGGQQGQGVH